MQYGINRKEFHLSILKYVNSAGEARDLIKELMSKDIKFKSHIRFYSTPNFSNYEFSFVN
tara:strand:+ start:866 stop:1045 length:180 start_codon:yes stop_codon:yes gene_type:complete